MYNSNKIKQTYNKYNNLMIIKYNKYKQVIISNHLMLDKIFILLFKKELESALHSQGRTGQVGIIAK